MTPLDGRDRQFERQRMGGTALRAGGGLGVAMSTMMEPVSMGLLWYDGSGWNRKREHYNHE